MGLRDAVEEIRFATAGRSAADLSGLASVRTTLTEVAETLRNRVAV
ncbi:MAG TPA: hypothetical protein VH988_19840 [Thermoanaerobaculia bacterium]|jgi:hypothetical protein|nr:hypothetical protein [Thermoanaerobaculia bacterium]